MNHLEMLSGSGIMKHAQRISGMLSESGNPQKKVLIPLVFLGTLAPTRGAATSKRAGPSTQIAWPRHPRALILGRALTNNFSNKRCKEGPLQSRSL
jgi:hypothetical protein